MSQPDPTLEPLVLERTINAPVDRVWQAWTDPVQMADWYSPNPNLETTAECDLRVGGAWSVVMDTHTVRGEYVEVDEPELLAFTWHFDHEEGATPTLVTVNLTAEDDAITHLRLTHTGHPDAADRDDTEEGWTLSLARLQSADL